MPAKPTGSPPWISLAVVAALWLACATTRAADGDSSSPNTPDKLPDNRGVMQRLSNFTLDDAVSGRSVMLFGFMGKKAVVLVFLGVDCPVGNLYASRLVELNKEYAPKGVVFLGVNSNASEGKEAIARYAKEYGITFPVLKDSGNGVADSALVERTCETLVLDGAARVRYRGAIDDQYIQGKSKDRPTHNYVRDALDDLIAGRPVKVASSPVAGCLIERTTAKPVLKAKPRIRGAAPEIARAIDEAEAAHPIDPGKPTYSGRVAAIIADKCQSCHRPGQVAPFALLTYDDARRKAAMIKEVVDDRRMPPWQADPRHGVFQNDRGLSASDRSALLAWVDQGAPLGDPAAMPPPRTYPDSWTIGKPDVVFEIPEPYYVPAQGVISYVHFPVPTGWKEDHYIQAAEAVPGDRSVVHHIIVYTMDRTKKNAAGRPELVHFCAYAPGDLPTILPEGTAKKIPAGVDLVFQIHYTPNGKVRVDRSKVGLILAKSKPQREAFTVSIANTDFLIPARAGDVAVASSFVTPADVRLISFLPHMHLRGKDFKYTITRPGEKPFVALSVPAYDFAWQSNYILKEPLNLPKGTRVDCLAHFDNSPANPYNPDPNQLVRWGEQTFEEMMIGFLDMDVPLGTPSFRGGELVSSRDKTTFTALAAVRKLVGDKKGARNSTSAKTIPGSARP